MVCRYLIHCDMHNYFASVEMLDNPYLEYIPIAVCGDIELRHGIVLSKNDLAKARGVVTGESIYEAKKKCPDLVYVKADYQKYLKYTKLSRAIYQRYADDIYPYGMDEAWIDVSSKCKNMDDAIEIARIIKKLILQELGLKIAVGISFNYIFAKLGSDQKSDDVFVIEKEHFLEKTEYFPAFSLLFVGSKTRTALKKLDILTIGDLRRADKMLLKHYLGKKGLMLQDFANGDDSEFKPVNQNDNEIKSLSNTITAPRDLNSKDEICAFIYILSDAINKRLEKHHLAGKTIALIIKQNDFQVFNKQKTLDTYVKSKIEIYNTTLYIFSLLKCTEPIRSVSLRISSLTDDTNVQLTLFETDIDQETKELFEKFQKTYGTIEIEKSSTTKDWEE